MPLAGSYWPMFRGWDPSGECGGDKKWIDKWKSGRNLLCSWASVSRFLMRISPRLNPAQVFRGTLLPRIGRFQLCRIDVFRQQIGIIRSVARPIHLVHTIDLMRYSTAGAVVYQDVGFREINRRGHLLHEQVGILTEVLPNPGVPLICQGH
jgi:hypothetical protein